MTTEERLNTLEELTATTAELAIEVGKLVIETRQQLLELQRENRQTRRIWIAIARKQELFDDDEFKDVFGED